MKVVDKTCNHLIDRAENMLTAAKSEVRGNQDDFNIYVTETIDILCSAVRELNRKVNQEIGK